MLGSKKNCSCNINVNNTRSQSVSVNDDPFKKIIVNNNCDSCQNY
jgi:hypothetical protein